MTVYLGRLNQILVYKPFSRRQVLFFNFFFFLSTLLLGFDPVIKIDKI